MTPRTLVRILVGILISPIIVTVIAGAYVLGTFLLAVDVIVHGITFVIGDVDDLPWFCLDLFRFWRW